MASPFAQDGMVHPCLRSHGSPIHRHANRCSLPHCAKDVPHDTPVFDGIFTRPGLAGREPP